MKVSSLAIVAVLLHLSSALAFQASLPLSCSGSRRSSLMMMSAERPVVSRKQAVRDMASLAAFLPLALSSAPSFAAEEATTAAAAPAAEEEEGDQVLSVDKINGKKAAVLGGALVAADIIAGLLTGRSVLRIVGGKEDSEDWKVKVVNKLLEKEKAEAAARMGVTVTTEAQPSGKERGPGSTGDYAKTDPFEIAKQKYKKKESIEDLKKKLRTQLTEEDDE